MILFLSSEQQMFFMCAVVYIFLRYPSRRVSGYQPIDPMCGSPQSEVTKHLQDSHREWKTWKIKQSGHGKVIGSVMEFSHYI